MGSENLKQYYLLFDLNASKKVFEQKINTSIWFCCVKNSLMEDKRKVQGAEGTLLLEPHTAHPTSELDCGIRW